MGRNFQTDNVKHTKNRHNQYNPEFNSFHNIDKKNADKLNKLEANSEKFTLWASFFLHYPDIFIDMITPEDSGFRLFPYQRFLLRVFFRYQYVFLTATRGFSKSYMEIMASFLNDVFRPRLKNSITAAGSKQQGRDIANEKVEELLANYPALNKEIKNKNVGRDYYELQTHNDSMLTVVGCHNSSRGGRKHQGCIEEAFDIDVTTLNEVILPMFNVKRRAVSGFENELEFDEQLWYVTTAGYYDTDICKKQLSLLAQMSVQEKYCGNGTSFVFGSSYELPVHHGLLKESKVESIKSDPSFSNLSFDREYRSKWIKFSDKSFFNIDIIEECRTLKYAELSQDLKNHKGDFYIISYDVSRIGGNANDASIATIIRCTERTDGSYFKNVVAMYSYEDKNAKNTSLNSVMHFKNQCIALKRLVEIYDAKALIVDGNGVGSGLMDYLTDVTEDEEYGKTYKPYSVSSVNADSDKGEKIDGAMPILHLIKATAEINESIHNVILGHVQTKAVRFLMTPRDVESDIIKKYGKRKNMAEDMLSQNRQSDSMVQEMMQLEREMSGTHFKLKTMTRSQRKDRFSSLEYGVWWITRFLEPQNKNKNKQDTWSSYVSSAVTNKFKTKQYY